MAAGLDIRDLTVSLADGERRFTLAVPEMQLATGHVVGLTGPSGTGKTMLLEVLGLLRRPAPGATYRLRHDSEIVDLAGLWGEHRTRAPELRSQYFGFVPQSGGLLPFLSVRENIHLSQRIAERIDDAWQDSLTERLGLSSIRNLPPAALSIGQRQRVAIARALAHRPAFVIADEPTAALDPEAAENAMRLLIEAATEGGAGVIISSHDLALLERFDIGRLALSVTSDSGAREVVSTLGPRMAA